MFVEVTGPFCNVTTFVGTQLLSTYHRIKTSDCYRVPSELTNLRPFDLIDDADSFSADETPPTRPAPPLPPVIPSGNSTPPTKDVSEQDNPPACPDTPSDLQARPDSDGAPA